MAYVPVICDNCGTLFAVSNIIGGTGIATFAGSTVGPCPVCGKSGRIPDGTYEFAHDTLKLLQGPQRTKDELRRFAQILRNVVEGDTSIEQAQTTILHEMPNLAALTEELAKIRNAQLRMFWIKVILTAVSLLLASQNVDIHIDIHDVINATIEQQIQPE